MKRCPDCGCFVRYDELDDFWECNNPKCNNFINGLVFTNDPDYLDMIE